jgi:hypothetical protein
MTQGEARNAIGNLKLDEFERRRYNDSGVASVGVGHGPSGHDHLDLDWVGEGCSAALSDGIRLWHKPANALCPLPGACPKALNLRIVFRLAAGPTLTDVLGTPTFKFFPEISNKEDIP